jgi:hypothetical protein
MEDFMKKFLVLTAVLFTALTIETHAIGLGLQGGASILDGFTPGLSLLISPNEQVHGALTWFIGDEGVSLGGSLDYWFLPIDLTTLGPGNLIFFVGGGAYAQISLLDGDFGIGAGLRVPVGLDWKMDFLDAFVQIVPLTGLGLLPSLGFSGIPVDANIGVRFWIGG